MSRNRLQKWVLTSLTALSLMSLSFGSSACGRTEVDDLIGAQGNYDVEARRELELADQEIVLVELMAPASSLSIEQLESMPAGLVIDEVVERLMPDETQELVVDTTSQEASLQVWVGDELRALVWM